MSGPAFALAALPVLIWLGLLWLWGSFWRADQRLDEETPAPGAWPAVVAVVPARNEAAVIGRSVTSLLGQDYPGRLRVVVVDDSSDDETRAVAERAASAAGGEGRLVVIRAEPAAPGWTGKLWALAQGVEKAPALGPEADFFLFTDADVAHDAANLRHLVAKACAEGLDLVSLMVRLNCESQWERLLVPAFVFFFQMLYPFRRVNKAGARTAAAAGGCMLVRRAALARTGGLEGVRGELIDDCALARALKAHGPIWLGLATATRSLRRYRGLQDIWDMVARSAYHQLRYSPLRLVATLAAMTLTFLVPPLAALGGSLAGEPRTALLGIFAWLLMMRCYGPTLKLYGRPWLSGLDLPVAALLFSLMTLDSARRHRRGLGVSWKGRSYGRAPRSQGRD